MMISLLLLVLAQDWSPAGEVIHDETICLKYQVRIDDVTPGMTQTTVQLAKTTDTTWSPPIDLKNGHAYRWWVRSMNSLGQGWWSVSRDFAEV